MPCPCRSPAVLCRGFEKSLSERHGHGTACVNQTRSHYVNQMGTTESKSLATRQGHGMVLWIRLYWAFYWEVAVEQAWFRGQFRVSNHEIWQVKKLDNVVVEFKRLGETTELKQRGIESKLRYCVITMLQLGLVCFRLKGSDELNQKLLSNINASGKIHMVPASVNEKYVIRFCAVVQNATEEQIGRSNQIYSSCLTQQTPALRHFVFSCRHDILPGGTT